MSSVASVLTGTPAVLYPNLYTGASPVVIPPTIIASSLGLYPTLYYEGQTLNSDTGGGAFDFLRFDDNVAPTAFSELGLPTTITSNFANYNFLEVSGTIPLYMNYQPNPDVNTYGIARLACQGFGGAGIPETNPTTQITYTFNPDQNTGTINPKLGNTCYFNFTLQKGVNINADDTAVFFIIYNPDTNAYALGDGSQFVVGGTGVVSSSMVISFKLFN
jgi:hypothetical protein